MRQIPPQNYTEIVPRQLSTEQSLADADYFVRNVELPKLNAKIDLQTTPVIFYGGQSNGSAYESIED